MAGLKYIIFGASGQVGTAFKSFLGDKGALFFDKGEFDLTDPKRIKSSLEKLSPGLIINASAYTAVDHAEKEEEIAYRINADAPGEMAKYAAAKNIPFIHYSTDYVFDGSGNHKRKESEKAAPLNAYGRTKLAGEQKVAAAGGKYLILRTSWVYCQHGKNFLLTMLKAGSEKETLKIVADQIGAPTYAYDIAEQTLKIIGKASGASKFPSGIYNLCNKGETSWHGFAEKIFELAKKKGIKIKIKEVLPITTAEYPTPAKRPLNSRLDLTKLKDTFAIEMPEWGDALAKCMKKL